MQVLERAPQPIAMPAAVKSKQPQKHRLVAQWHQVNGQLTCRWVTETI